MGSWRYLCSGLGVRHNQSVEMYYSKELVQLFNQRTSNAIQHLSRKHKMSDQPRAIASTSVKIVLGKTSLSSTVNGHQRFCSLCGSGETDVACRRAALVSGGLRPRPSRLVAGPNSDGGLRCKKCFRAPGRHPLADVCGEHRGIRRQNSLYAVFSDTRHLRQMLAKGCEHLGSLMQVSCNFLPKGLVCSHHKVTLLTLNTPPPVTSSFMTSELTSRSTPRIIKASVGSLGVSGSEGAGSTFAT